MEVLICLLFGVLTVVFFLVFLKAKKNTKPYWVLILYAIATAGFLWWTIKYIINIFN